MVLLKEVPGCSIKTGVETMLELEPMGVNVAAASLHQVDLGFQQLSLHKGKGDVKRGRKSVAVRAVQ